MISIVVLNSMGGISVKYKSNDSLTKLLLLLLLLSIKLLISFVVLSLKPVIEYKRVSEL